MEAKINIVEILADKPQGTKLYSSACGKCKLEEVDDKSFKISFYNSKFGFMNGGEGYLDKNGKLYDDGECVVFPSKEMRDWSKFSWKKGDILTGNNGTREVLFHSWVNDSYTKFIGLHCMIAEDIEGFVYDEGTTVFNTNDFKCIEDEYAVQCYISTIEERLGGKLNRETLEIEKTQPEFKDGDIVLVESHMLGINTSSMIAIFRKEEEIGKYKFSPALCESNEHDTYLREDTVVLSPSDIKIFRPADDSEKQQLFDALAKKGKAWDAEKKQIVDLKPKCEFKPFDKVLGRNEKGDVWEAELFSHYREESQYPFRCIGFSRKYCIPYNEETAHLLGTTDEWKGGEG